MSTVDWKAQAQETAEDFARLCDRVIAAEAVLDHLRTYLTLTHPSAHRELKRLLAAYDARLS